MNDFQRYLAEEFVEEYEEGRLSRREALKLIASVTGSLALATSLLAACAPPAEETPTQAVASPSPAPASATPGSAAQESPAPTPSPAATQPAEASATPAAAASPGATPAVSGTVAPDDPAVVAGPVEFPGDGDGAALLGYLARPAAEGEFPVVLVCHENRGLTAHIEDVTRRLAKAGYVGLAVDLLSRQGGTAAVGSEQVPGALGNIPPEQFVADFVSGWRYLATQAFAAAGRVGMVGFCFGGGVTWRVAVGLPELRAAVPFYGPHPPVESVPNINAAVLAVYAERDQRINQGIPAIESAMQAAGKTYEKVIYPEADHAFHNDTGPRYNASAAQDAWQRTLAWFAAYLAA